MPNLKSTVPVFVRHIAIKYKLDKKRNKLIYTFAKEMSWQLVFQNRDLLLSAQESIQY